jgi:NADPH2:quinone reductase
MTTTGEGTAMRAALVSAFGSPDVLQVQTAPLPTLAPHEVLVSVRAAAVTPLDTYLRKGVPVGDYTPTPPYTPGFALAGEVAALGAEATGFRIGDRVYGRARSGAAAEFAACDAAAVHPLPAKIGFADAALIAVPYETAYYSLVDLAGAAGGETVLVQGAAGSVGAAAVQLARTLGLRVLATCSNADREAVIGHGAHEVLDYADGPDRIEAKVRELTRQRGVEIIIEIAAKANLGADLALAAPGGRIVIVGGTGQTPFDALPVIAKGLRLLGVDLRSVSPRRALQIHAVLAAGLENGTLRPRVAHRFPLEEIAAAHAAIEVGQGSGGVAVLMQPDDDSGPTDTRAAF